MAIHDPTDGRRLRFRAIAALLGLSLVLALPAAAEDAQRRVADLERRIEDLERALERLRVGAADPARLTEIERRIDLLAAEIEDLRLGDSAGVESAEEGRYGLGPAASKVYALDRGVSVGGYGEMLYQNFDSAREDGTPSGAADQIDLLRAVVYFGYKFNDRIVFNSEVEYEHASTGREGEVSLELAYLDFLVRDGLNVRAGLVLVPMGHVNELHEPPVFLGARRPHVEERILPTTWRENGVGVFGEAGAISYRAYVVSSMASVGGTSSGAPGFSASGIRDGRTKGSKSTAEDLAFTGRVDWTPRRGITVGTSWFTGDTGQGRRTPAGTEFDAELTVWDVHADLRHRGLQARLLYVDTSIEDVEDINLAQQFTGPESVGSSQYGWYAEVGYDVLAGRDTSHALIPYARYERYDTQEEVPAGYSRDPVNKVTVTTLGVAWKPILNVVLKADFERIENEANLGVDQFNLALGFLF